MANVERSGGKGATMRWVEQEPSINDMLQDPIMQAVMRRDAVEEAELRRLLDRLRRDCQDRVRAKLHH